MLCIFIKMRIRQLHEVFLQPKMFETIGFHHQGRYSISAQVYRLSATGKDKQYAFPLLVAHRIYLDAFEEGDMEKVDIDDSSYQTKKFDVSFNEQEFVFQSGCRFKLQHDVQSYPEHSHSTIFMHLQLLKHKVVEDEQGKMASIDNIVKNSEEPKDSSNEKIIGVEINSLKIARSSGNISSGKGKSNKPFQKVTQVTILIDPTQKNASQMGSIYQTILFPNQQYFGKLFFMINHIKIGYKIRARPSTMYNFARTRSVSIGSRKMLSAATEPDDVRPKVEANQQVIGLLQENFQNPGVLFDELVRQPIISLNKLIELEKDLQKDIEKQSPQMLTRNLIILKEKSQIKDRRSLSTIGSPYSSRAREDLQNFFISVPSDEISQSLENLLSYYECQKFAELYSVIFEESCRLIQLLTYKWMTVVTLMNKQKWCAQYFHKTIRNFREEAEYLVANRVSAGLQPVYEANQVIFQPKLKFKFYIHQFLPQFSIKKEKNAAKPMLGTSSQHILFVLVHGFNGNEFDMNRIKSFISYFCSPHFLVLKNISPRILEDLDTIGRAAADEIRDFVKLRPFIRRINFVGFSLGGVIIRACLPYLKQYHRCFNILLTLSSPHLGVREVKNCIVKTGLQVLHKFRGAKNIKQLLLDLKPQENEEGQRRIENDEEIIEEEQLSYLQKLSKDPSLNSFNLVLFCGSQDDKYVPGFSAVLDYRGDGERMAKMQDNIKKNIKNLHQVYVKFSAKKRGSMWDRITGRRIHINFLDDDSFLYFLLAQYFHIF